jgi:hypothetical protein
MPSPRLKDEKVQQLAAVAQAYGKMLADQAYGPEGPGLDVDLATMEDLAVTMQEALLKGMCEQLTRQQAARVPASQPCPTCGGECEVEPPPPDDPDRKDSSRRMQTRGGAFDLAEPRCYCRSCRRSFFPSADGLED